MAIVMHPVYTYTGRLVEVHNVHVWPSMELFCEFQDSSCLKCFKYIVKSTIVCVKSPSLAFTEHQHVHKQIILLYKKINDASK